MKILNAQQMQTIDQQTSDLCGVPSLTLMENAGFNLYLALDHRFGDLRREDIAIICGKGNNGGDGLVLARQLIQRGVEPDIFLLSRADEIKGDAAVNLGILTKSDYPVFEVTSEEEWETVSASFDVYSIIVDAILGTGITKNLEGLFARVVSDINRSRAFVLAVDIPSGMFSDSLDIAPSQVWSDLTVTFTAPKIAHILSPAVDALGELEIVQIGTPPGLLDQPKLYLNLLDHREVSQYQLARLSHSHKGTYGHLVVTAGSRGKGGAAALTAEAALRAGSGLVTAVVPESIQQQVASFRAEVMTLGLPETESGTFSSSTAPAVLELLQEKDALALGPGITIEPETVSFVEKVVRQSPVPLVIDADGLNGYEGRPEQIRNEFEQPIVLTPHPGEFSRLTGISTAELLRNQIEITREFCLGHRLWVVLKTFRPLIGTPDGSLFVSPQGNPGMATAGMGDVLTGIIASVLGQYSAVGMLDPDEISRAVCLGVFLHGTAGDLAAEVVEPEALLAGDLLDHIGAAFRRLDSAE